MSDKILLTFDVFMTFVEICISVVTDVATFGQVLCTLIATVNCLAILRLVLCIL